jgi:hypothetical protein
MGTEVADTELLFGDAKLGFVYRAWAWLLYSTDLSSRGISIGLSAPGTYTEPEQFAGRVEVPTGSTGSDGNRQDLSLVAPFTLVASSVGTGLDANNNQIIELITLRALVVPSDPGPIGILFNSEFPGTATLHRNSLFVVLESLL